MSGLAAPPGDPAALRTAIDDLAATEAALADAATRIEATLAEGAGQAIDELRSRSGRATSGIRAAHERYAAATGALREYAVELDTFHSKAHAAIKAHDEATARLASAQWALVEAERQMFEAALSPDMPHLFEEARAARQRAQHAVDIATDAVVSASEAYERARDAIEEAARIAAARIQAGFEATKDSLLDKAMDVVDSIANLLGSLVEWALEFFRAVLEVIVAAVELFVTALLVVLAVIALIALLIVALALVLVAITVVVLLVTMLALMLIELAAAGFIGNQLADALGLEGAARLRVIVGMMSAVNPALGIFIASRLLDEALKPAPEVDLLDESALHPDQAGTLDQLDGMVPQDAADLIEMAGMVDAIGGSEQAVVNITQVVDEAGNVSWIVTLPSTQDWVVGGDAGAPNDLDADLMLMLFPELQTQYEKAVLDAMAQAGIGRDEPVILTGWSLGGIMSGSLIESGAGGYNYAGLVCAGSPIDEMAIPPDVPVLQVKHTLDPVHRTDIIDMVTDQPGRVEIWDGSRSGGASPEIKNSNVVGHDSGDYLATLTDHLRYNAAHGLSDLSDPFTAAFPYDDPSTPERVTVSHAQYAFQE